MRMLRKQQSMFPPRDALPSGPLSSPPRAKRMDNFNRIQLQPTNETHMYTSLIANTRLEKAACDARPVLTPASEGEITTRGQK